MNTTHVSDTWERGSRYEQYIGRWSRKVAPLFLAWLDQPTGQRWLDVGCGTGGLSAAILDHCTPSSVVGVEPSEGFLKLAVQNLAGKARFLAGNAAALPLDGGTCDVVVSGLVLNFVPTLPPALAEMRRVTR
jgi:ubiquinone/menaquinone biosynthesis C-methylase UbiE